MNKTVPILKNHWQQNFSDFTFPTKSSPFSWFLFIFRLPCGILGILQLRLKDFKSKCSGQDKWREAMKAGLRVFPLHSAKAVPYVLNTGKILLKRQTKQKSLKYKRRGTRDGKRWESGGVLWLSVQAIHSHSFFGLFSITLSPLYEVDKYHGPSSPRICTLHLLTTSSNYFL